MKNNHAVIICVESVFIEDRIMAFVSSKSFSRRRSGTKHNNIFINSMFVTVTNKLALPQDISHICTHGIPPMY